MLNRYINKNASVIIMIEVLVFIFGLVIGSFLNVCIYRLPIKLSVVFPRSHCPVCHMQLKWRENIPLASYLLLHGKCRYCSAIISWRYPFVEVVTGLAFMLFNWQFGVTYSFFLWSVLFSTLLVTSIIDISYGIIPNRLLLSVALMGIFIHVIGNQSKIFTYFIAGTIGAALILLMAIIGRVLYKQQAMGGGDVKLFAVVGLFIGMPDIFIVFLLAVVSGAVWGVVGMIIGKYQRKSALPFAPFIALGTIIYFLIAFLFKLNLSGFIYNLIYCI
jgi:leader peptidase (prepilin peptidase) / N-methyltransferase